MSIDGFANLVGLVVVAGFTIGTVRGLLAGRINLAGLLEDEDGHRTPTRAAGLVSVILACVSYLGLVLADPSVFPAPPPALLATLGLGGGAYLTGKVFPIATRVLGQRLRGLLFGGR